MKRVSLACALGCALAFAPAANGQDVRHGLPADGAVYPLHTRFEGLPCRVAEVPPPAPWFPGQTTHQAAIETYIFREPDIHVPVFHCGWILQPFQWNLGLTPPASASVTSWEATATGTYSFTGGGGESDYVFDPDHRSGCPVEPAACSIPRWEARPGPQVPAAFGTFRVAADLQADAGGPYSVLRGQRVTLDGSKSAPGGEITSYEWTFASAEAGDPDTPNCPIRDGVRTPGAKVSITVLCPITATLTVSDGDRTDSDTVPITVVPRRFKPIPYLKPQERHDLEAELRLRRRLCEDCLFGKDVDARAPRSQQIIHRPRDPFSAAQAPHDGGPFDGMWYTTGHAYVVQRRARINKQLFPRSYTYRLNRDTHTLGQLNLVRDQVIAHEQTHERLIAKAMRSPKFRPQDQIEASVAADQPRLRSVVDGWVGTAETLLCQATTEDRVHDALARTWGRRHAEIYLQGSSEPYRIPNLAVLGDGGLLECGSIPR
jgi:hypothetical protein